MTYAVKEIFYTLQGEGANAGRPAVFCRFAGCNLWSGHEKDRATRRVHVLRHRLRRHRRPRRRQVPQRRASSPRPWPSAGRAPTGAAGRSSCARAASRSCSSTRRSSTRCTRRGFEIAVETNGTLEPPDGIDWICVSPKAGSNTVLLRGNELKLVYPQDGRAARALRRRRLRALLPAADGRPRDRAPTSRAASSTASRTRSGASASRPTRSLGIR